MLGHGHVLDVRKAHLLHIFDQRVGQLAIVERFTQRFFAPRTRVDFIDAQRRAQGIALPPLNEPIFIRPNEFVDVPDDGCVLGRRLEEETERISAQTDISMQIPHFVFVMRALTDAWDKYLPHTGRSQRAHLVEAAIPGIEIANHADALGIRRPDGEAGARDAVDGAQLRSEFVVNTAFVAFAKQVQVGFAQCRQEGIGITGAAYVSAVIGDHQVIGVNAIGLFNCALKNIRFGDAFEFDGRFVFFVNGLKFDFCGAGKQSASDQAGAIAKRMQPQQLVWGTVPHFDKTVQFILGQEHGACNLPEANQDAPGKMKGNALPVSTAN